MTAVTIAYLRNFYVNITTTEDGIGHILLKWAEACQCDILLKPHQLVI